MATQTILKALKSKINFPLPEESYTTALIDAGLDGDAPYTKEMRRDVELCAAELIKVVCTSGNVSEGGYSLSVGDKKELRRIRSLYLNFWGMTDDDSEKPIVSSGSGLW